MLQSFQSAALDILSQEERCLHVSKELYYKAKVTLNPLELALIPDNWFEEVNLCLACMPIYVRMCWLKSVTGAWCTSVRLHTIIDRGCIFGCIDSKDELCHYLICPVLWQFARDTLHPSELSVMVPQRLCLQEPSSVKLKTLAFCHALYHACVNDTVCMDNHGFARSAPIVQQRAAEICRFCLHLVGGR
jgi:hypothetical protein